MSFFIKKRFLLFFVCFIVLYFKAYYAVAANDHDSSGKTEVKFIKVSPAAEELEIEVGDKLLTINVSAYESQDEDEDETYCEIGMRSGKDRVGLQFQLMEEDSLFYPSYKLLVALGNQKEGGEVVKAKTFVPKQGWGFLRGFCTSDDFADLLRLGKWSEIELPDEKGDKSQQGLLKYTRKVVSVDNLPEPSPLPKDFFRLVDVLIEFEEGKHIVKVMDEGEELDRHTLPKIKMNKGLPVLPKKDGLVVAVFESGQSAVFDSFSREVLVVDEKSDLDSELPDKSGKENNDSVSYYPRVTQLEGGEVEQVLNVNGEGDVSVLVLLNYLKWVNQGKEEVIKILDRVRIDEFEEKYKTKTLEGLKVSSKEYKLMRNREDGIINPIKKAENDKLLRNNELEDGLALTKGGEGCYGAHTVESGEVQQLTDENETPHDTGDIKDLRNSSIERDEGSIEQNEDDAAAGEGLTS